MSVLINGMKMPTEKPARIVLNPNGQLFVDYGTWFTEYEAIELPDHGDLVDKDLLTGMCDAPHWCVWLSEIEDAPVVIPAERSECGEA